MGTAICQKKLPLAVQKKIEVWTDKFPVEQRKAAVIPALKIVQEENGGWLTEYLMDQVADFLKMPKVAVYEVATFYTMFELKKVGKYIISICTNVSCMLCNSDSIVEHLEKKLGIKFGETTKDGKFTLKEVECLAACGGAPAMQIGLDYYENLTADKIDAVLAKLE